MDSLPAAGRPRAREDEEVGQSHFNPAPAEGNYNEGLLPRVIPSAPCHPERSEGSKALLHTYRTIPVTSPFHRGFNDSISSTFLLLLQLLICFSRAIADSTSEVCS